MARLLLGSALVNRLWLAPLCLAASGCLYIERLNEPPSVHIDSVTSQSVVRGEPVYVTASASDDQDSSLDLKVDFRVESADGQPLGDCDYALEAPGKTATLAFYRTGVFDVFVSTKDRYGSPTGSNAMVRLQVDDAAPMFSSNAVVKPTSPKNACNVFTAGEPVTLLLDGTVVDQDANASKAPGCGTTETLTYTWRVAGIPAGAKNVLLTPFTGGACAAPTAASGPTLTVAKRDDQVCLYTDATLAGSANAPAMYDVVLDVSDGTNTSTITKGFTVSAEPDQPPCITDTVVPAGSYAVDRNVVQTLQVTGVADDRDLFGSPGLTFAWSVWSTSENAWHTVPSLTGPSYSIDLSPWGVGEIVKVRVEAIDRTGARASCALTVDDCGVTSCSAGLGGCSKWKTWTLELR